MNALGYPSLQPKTPVPSDIEISQSIVKEVGLLDIDKVAQQYVMMCLVVFDASLSDLIALESAWTPLKSFHGALPRPRFLSRCTIVAPISRMVTMS